MMSGSGIKRWSLRVRAEKSVWDAYCARNTSAESQGTMMLVGIVRNKREWAKRETLENYSIGMMTSSISREMAHTNALRGIQNRNARLTVSDVLLQRPSDNSELVRGQVIRP